MADMWTDVLERVAEMAQDPGLLPTGILIMDDHAPPLWSGLASTLFRPGEVSWASLWPRADGGLTERQAAFPESSYPNCIRSW